MISLRAAKIDGGDVFAFEVPTERPETDATHEWDSTTVVVVEITAAGRTGLGYTYAGLGAAPVTRELLSLVVDRDVFSLPALWESMFSQVRNLSNRGLTQMAISAIDIALWDLKARLLDLSLVDLLGRVRDRIPIYGSGGFTSYDLPQLQGQLSGWVEKGIPRVKIKVGRDPKQDVRRVHAARDAIGDDAELYVDANGGYNLKQALGLSEPFADYGVTWFEEPVPSDDLEGLRTLRRRVPPPMEITAGEYGDNVFYFRQMLEAESVDVIQPDVTRCGGMTGFLAVAALCDAFHVPLSAHTAPQLAAHICCAARPARHAEYFFDHTRIHNRFFDGVLEPEEGYLRPDRDRVGHGLLFKRPEAEPFAVLG